MLSRSGFVHNARRSFRRWLLAGARISFSISDPTPQPQPPLNLVSPSSLIAASIFIPLKFRADAPATPARTKTPNEASERADGLIISFYVQTRCGFASKNQDLDLIRGFSAFSDGGKKVVFNDRGRR